MDIKALTTALVDAIKKCKATGGENENAFSVDATFEDGEFKVRCAFYENHDMTIMYQRNTDDATVQSLFDLTNLDEIQRLAGVMIDENWITVA